MGIRRNVSFLEGLVSNYVDGERVSLITEDSLSSEQEPGKRGYWRVQAERIVGIW